jgi:succinate-semialdehyde dehydrogenase/glutarate-semialdehyde dehydrogenase
MAIASINPATGKLIRQFHALSEQLLDEKLERAWRCFHEWRKTPFTLRAKALIRAAEILEARKREIGTLMTTEMGKTLLSAIAEVEKCALGCRYYADNGEAHLASEEIATSASKSFVTYQPLGPVLAIMPWNFPLWQVFRFAAPALMAGNVGLLKHASNVPQCALLIEEVFHQAGFPNDAFQTLLVEPDIVPRILKDPRVVAATLTGSEPAGRSVASIAGSEIKKTVLELGGSDPFIVMRSVDVKSTAVSAVKARTINNGQSCIAAKRFIVDDSIYSDFEQAFVEAMRSLRVGDPMEEQTDIGPLATPKILEELDSQVQQAVRDGGRVLTGGKRIDGVGNYYEATAIADLPRSSAIFHQEMFGPVALLFRVKGIDEAIELANDSPFGLGASVWTTDPEEQHAAIERIEAGQVFINASVASDPRVPFGGVKRSGYGRELSVLGIREFVNIKTIWIK